MGQLRCESRDPFTDTCEKDKEQTPAYLKWKLHFKATQNQ